MATSYEYYNAVLYAIGRISQGLTPTAAIDEANISWTIFDKYVRDDATLSALYDAAQQRGYDTMADLLLYLHKPYFNDGTPNPYFTTDPKAQKVISDNIKWLLARRKSATYGDRVEVKIEATVEHVITSQLEAARQRSQLAISERRGDVIDAEYEVISYPSPPPPPSH